MTTEDAMLLTDLPDVVFTRIFSYFCYDEIARTRMVCRKFNETGWYLLNRGFVAAEKYQSAALKAVKAQLPRRESERRKHPLSKKCDILVAIETRLSMLSMAFSRFIESQLCCFIPGKVIDELFRVMKSLDSFTECQPPHQILQELRDVSTMAIEHFDEKIAPILRNKEIASLASHRPPNLFDIPTGFISPRSELFDLGSFSTVSHMYPRQFSVIQTVSESLARIKKLEKTQKQVLGARNRVPVTLKETIRQQKRAIKEMQTTINEQTVRLSNFEAVVNDLKRQYDEMKNLFPQKFVMVASNIVENELPSTEDGTTSANFDPDDIILGELIEPMMKKRKTMEN